MKTPLRITILAVLSSFAFVHTGVAVAQKPIAYPAKGQSAKQKQEDDAKCNAWARQDTGIDPAKASAPAPQNTGPATGGGERVRGAARGAVGGAVIGGIAGDAGAGAGIGAAAGTMAGGARARRNQADQNAQAQAQQQQTLSTYYRAYSACMEGRGYTIK